MNDNDLTDMMEHIASDYCDSRIMIDGREPWSEQPIIVKNELKAAILPWVFRAAPLLEQKVIEGNRSFITQAREAGATDTEILDLMLAA
jgi:hypothetical protein